MITLNLLAGGTMSVPAADIVDYTTTRKGSMLVYMQGGEKKMVEVYEAPSRLKSLIVGVRHE